MHGEVTAVRLPLIGRNGQVRGHALVDQGDAEYLSQWRWHLTANGYAARSIPGKQRQVRMHRQLLGLEAGDPRLGDHINRDRLDNRRANLRVVSLAENAQNTSPRRGYTSPHRGVHFYPDRPSQLKWGARVNVNKRIVLDAWFSTEEEAAQAALEARRKHMPFQAD